MSEISSWQAPLWLTDAYLEEVLAKYLKDDTVHIENVDIRPATSKGENYISVMSRIKISFSTASETHPQPLSFIMKYSYESDPFISKLMTSYDVYNTEMQMYEYILPQLAEILRESGDTDKLIASTLKVDYERSAMIFEDLAVSDHVMGDRKKGMDMQHARKVMEKLAKFHAASAVLNERLDGALEKFDHGLFNRHTRGIGCIFEYFTQEAANFAKDSPHLGEYYHDKLSQLVPHVVDYGTRAYTRNPKHFYALSHGDFWINNMMMSYDRESQRLQDIVLIDFQFCNWSSPAVDLHYFFNTSLEPQLLLDPEVLAELVQCYHFVLSATLAKSKYQGHIPTLHEFHVQLEEGSFLAAIAALASRPVMTLHQSDDADFHSLVDDDERARKFRRNCYENPEFQRILEIQLPRFDRRGLLDLQK